MLYFAYQNHKNFPAGDLESLIDFSDFWNTEKNCFEYGQLVKHESIHEELTEEIVLKKYESFDIKNKLRIKLHDNSFFTGKESSPFEKVNHGKIMHEVFENIQTEKDISHAIDKMIFDGKISPKDKLEIKRKIDKIFKNDQIKNWFSDKWQVKSEAEIILTNGKTTRPDRVMSNSEKIIVIDYKFGEQEENKHHKQVRSYMEMLGTMEEKLVEGFLWYVDLDIVKQVTVET